MEQFNEQKDGFPVSSSTDLSEGEDVGVELLLQHRYLSELMGGILPSLLEPPWGSNVLVAGWCASGLVYEMAWKYPSMHFTGIDKNASRVKQAQTLMKDLDNAAMMVQDFQHLDDQIFLPSSFDLIYLRFLAGDVTLEQFLPLLRSLAGICRTRGLIVWTETELPITTSRACQQLCTTVQQALLLSSDAFAPGKSTWVTLHMNRWLSEAGFRISQSKTYAIDISTGSKGHEAFVRQIGISGEQVRALCVGKGMLTAAEFAKVFGEAQQDIQQENFSGMLYLRMLVGVKL